MYCSLRRAGIWGNEYCLSGDLRDFEGLASDLRAEVQKFTDSELPKVQVRCVVETGDPAAVIIEYAENEKVNLIAMPTHGYGTFRRFLLGSVTAKVLHDANVPVLRQRRTRRNHRIARIRSRGMSFARSI